MSKAPWFVVVLALLMSLLPAPAVATNGPVEIRIGAGEKSWPLALPYAQGDPELGRSVWEVVERDLEITGNFRLIDPKATIDTGGVEEGSFNFADWRTLNAAGLAKIAVKKTTSGITAEVWVYDVDSGSKILAKRFAGTEKQTRALGHALAREILIALTNDPGFFGTKVAAVREGKNKEIVVFDVDGSQVRRVTGNGSINLSPAWSPTGKRIAWTSYKRENPDIYEKDLATGRTRVLSAQQGINIGAAYSPDGKFVALSRSRNGDADIFILEAATGKVIRQLTEGGGIDVGPTWSPDGTQIAFSSERSGGSQIFVMPATGGTAKRVSRQGRFNSDPVWSPDGTRIAFVGRDPRFDVFIAELESGRTRRITQNMGSNEDPSWSPDGRYLVFSSTRSGRSEIWMATANGRHQVQLTSGGGFTQPSWSPHRN